MDSKIDIPKHLANHIKHHAPQGNQTLYVIGVISNPVRYHSRYRLAREWMKAMEATPHVRLCMVEAAFGDRHHEVTDSSNPWHHQVRTNSEIWIKENMINLGVRHLLPKDWKYLAWIDCDVFFRDPNWALETIQQLQHYPVVQPWQDCIDLGHSGTILERHESFGSLVSRGIRRQKKPHEPYKFGHPGFAWACTRAFWEAIGGVMDFAILGSGDHHMACGMVNEVDLSMHDQMSESFKRRAREWQAKAYRFTHGIIGHVATMCEHKFHGPKKRRYYRERWNILTEYQYNPERDLTYDAQGVLHLIGKPNLEQAIRKYNRSRFEDSIEDV